jgi:hypothetical protein
MADDEEVDIFHLVQAEAQAEVQAEGKKREKVAKEWQEGGDNVWARKTEVSTLYAPMIHTLFKFPASMLPHLDATHLMPRRATLFLI